MEARRVIKLKKAPKPEAPSLIHSPKSAGDPHLFKLGVFKYIRIGNHIFEMDGSYLGDYREKTEEIDTTTEEPEGMEEKVKLWVASQK